MSVFFCHSVMRRAYIKYMRNFNIKIFVAGTICFCAVSAYFFFSGEDMPQESQNEYRSYRKSDKKSAKFERKNDKRNRSRVIKKASRVRAEKPRLIALFEDEEAKLNEFSRQVLAELQAALDAEDFNEVRRLVEKLLERPPDPKFGDAGVAALLRRSAVDALGWFGAKGLPELVGLLADENPEIAQASLDQFNLALEDISLSDYERADIISMAAKVLTDIDGLEMMFMEINNMRHSVGAGLLVDICLNGTDAAKSLMKDQIEFFTGEDNIVTVEDIEKWLAANPDDPDDDDLYGGFKDDE